ncbi:MAG: hypothetical protein AAF975_09305, partial [Spirochaetota bacterium]
KPESGDKKPKAKVYGLASRVFIQDAHGDWAAGGKRFAEFYFLNDQKRPAEIALKTTETDTNGKPKKGAEELRSGLFVKRGDNLRMRVVTSEDSRSSEAIILSVYDKEDTSEDEKDKRKNIVVYRLGANSSKCSNIAVRSSGSDFKFCLPKSTAVNRRRFVSGVKELSTQNKDGNNNKKTVNAHWELQGLVQSIPLTITEVLPSGTYPLRFWVLVE